MKLLQGFDSFRTPFVQHVLYHLFHILPHLHEVLVRNAFPLVLRFERAELRQRHIRSLFHIEKSEKITEKVRFNRKWCTLLGLAVNDSMYHGRCRNYTEGRYWQKYSLCKNSGFPIIYIGDKNNPFASERAEFTSERL